MTRTTEAASHAVTLSACEWLVALHEETVTSNDCAMFVDWLMSSPTHVHEYLAAEMTWVLIGEVLSR